ncbi:MAG: stage III sporulation protein AA [Firmicutes bacterium]|nr:stage III sporulation protein AA [Bacillota bacterium]
MSVYYDKYNEIIRYVSKEIREVLMKVNPERLEYFEEIRLRANRPLILQNYYEDWFINNEGNLTKNDDNAFIVKQDDILKTLEIMSRNSIYAFQDDIRNGFLTLVGGHRVGIAGKTITEGRKVVNIKDISSLNIRISKEIKGCALKIIKYILENKNQVCNTLIVSPPQCGKTTLLRDMTRVLSNGVKEIGLKGMKVGLVDERSEIAACHKGLPQFDIGMRTDVLDACPKSIGMIMMVRSMSPQVIVTDEIGDQGDKDSIVTILNAGVKIVATAHGFNISELKSRREVLSLIEEKIFERYIVLSNANGPGTIEEIIDGTSMDLIYRRNSGSGYYGRGYL